MMQCMMRNLVLQHVGSLVRTVRVEEKAIFPTHSRSCGAMWSVPRVIVEEIRNKKLMTVINREVKQCA